MGQGMLWALFHRDFASKKAQIRSALPRDLNVGASRPALYLTLCVLILASQGCRRESPPSFTPSKEVIDLTADIEDPEELKLYKDLQTQVVQKLLALTGTPDKPILLGSQLDDAHLKRGYALYSRYCSQCHGVNGDGNGPAAVYLNPKPRNYTQGIFKFTSTPYGMKPRRADLVRTVRRGITGTSMPSFDRFSDEDVDAVVDYVMVLTLRGQLEKQIAQMAYDDGELPDDELTQEIIDELLLPWKESSERIVMPTTPMPPMTDETIALGHKLFLQQACNKCHGQFGRGGSIEKVEVGMDSWGHQAAAADLSSGMFRGGGRPIDIYRRISSGINGTPMPAFEKVFQENPEAIWHLVHFIKATGERRREGKEPLSAADLPTQAPVEQTPNTIEPTDQQDTPAVDDQPAAQAA